MFVNIKVRFTSFHHGPHSDQDGARRCVLEYSKEVTETFEESEN